MEIDKNLQVSGIYVLYYDTDDYMYYVGKSIHIWDRYVDHVHLLSIGKHHNYKLQQAYKIHGKPNIFLLEKTDENTLVEKEVYWIELLEAYTKGYNLTIGGEGAGYGDNSPSAKYSKETYEGIFYLLANTDWTYKEISAELSVELSIINSIAVGQSHKYLINKFPEYWGLIKERNKKRANKYTEDIYYELIKELAYTNIRFNVLAKKYNIKDSVIEDLAAGNTHKYLLDKYPIEYNLMLSKKGNRRCGPQSGLDYPAVLSPEGEIFREIKNAAKFAKEHNLHQGHFAELLKGRIKSHKGWKLN